MLIVTIFGLDILLTLLAANIVGPAPFRFSHYGLPGLLFRTPFYLLRLYIGIAALLLRRQPNWYVWGPALRLALAPPLAFWSTLPICPKAEPWVNLATGVLQGTILAWVAVRFSRRAAGFRPDCCKGTVEVLNSCLRPTGRVCVSLVRPCGSSFRSFRLLQERAEQWVVELVSASSDANEQTLLSQTGEILCLESRSELVNR